MSGLNHSVGLGIPEDIRIYPLIVSFLFGEILAVKFLFRPDLLKTFRW